MADKSFGLKQVNLIGASGTPRIESPNNLNINAVNVAISTDISVGGMVSLGAGTSISSPATNVLTLGTNSEERLRITSGGNIGIGNTNPLYAMHFKNAMSSTPSYIHMEVTGTNTVGGGGGIQFDTSASNNASNNGLYLAQISGERSSLNDGSNRLVFKTSRANSNGDDGNTHTPKTRMILDENGNVTINDGNLIIGTSGHGIDFSAASGSAAGSTSAILDDYEEGTHTCTAQNSVTLYSTADQISYTKIGRMVTVGGQIRVNSSNSNSQLELSLPFVCKGNGGEADGLYVGSVRFYSADIANDAVWVIAQSNPGEAKVSFINVRDNTTTSNVLATDNGYYMFTLTYFTA